MTILVAVFFWGELMFFLEGLCEMTFIGKAQLMCDLRYRSGGVLKAEF